MAIEIITQNLPKLRESEMVVCETVPRTHNASIAPQLRSKSRKDQGVWTLLVAQKRVELKNSPQMFGTELKNCQSLEDIRNLAESLNVDLRLTQLCSQLALNRMLETRCELEEIIEFFEEFSLNTSNAQNITILVDWHMRQQMSESDTQFLYSWIKNQISLGFFRGLEILPLLDKLSSSNGYIDQNQALRFSRSVFEGLCSSTVFKFHDVIPEVLNALLTSVSQGPISLDRSSLGIAIMEVSSPSQLKDVKLMKSGIASFLKWCILPRNSDGHLQTLDVNSASKILRHLQSAPTNGDISIIASASRALLACREVTRSSDSPLLENMKNWWRLLERYGLVNRPCQSYEWLRVERVLACGKVDEILAPYLRTINDEEKGLFILRHWLLPEIDNEYTYTPGKRNDIEDTFRARLRSSRGPYIIVLLKSLGKHFRKHSKWTRPLFSLLRKLGRSSIILTIVRISRKIKQPIPRSIIAEEIFHQAIPHPHIALMLFKATSNLPLEACPIIADVMIKNSPSASASSNVHKQRRGRSPYLSHRGTPVFREPRNILSPFDRMYLPPLDYPNIRQSRADLLSGIALAFAESPHLNPRAAFREVYRCYRIHKWYKLGPLSAEMTRALVTAGIIKGLKQRKWVSSRQVGWILEKVREVEGGEVAQGVEEIVYQWREKLMLENAAGQRLLKNLGLDRGEGEDVKIEDLERVLVKV